jgi:hypothetical protein
MVSMVNGRLRPAPSSILLFLQVHPANVVNPLLVNPLLVVRVNKKKEEEEE